jgi:WD40 repeat protein
LVSCGQDGNVRVWDLRKYKCMGDLNVHVRKYDEGALCLAESREGVVAVGGADGLVKLFGRGTE